jgi:hypothetical protein
VSDSHFHHLKHWPFAFFGSHSILLFFFTYTPSLCCVSCVILIWCISFVPIFQCPEPVESIHTAAPFNLTARLFQRQYLPPHGIHFHWSSVSIFYCLSPSLCFSFFILWYDTILFIWRWFRREAIESSMEIQSISSMEKDFCWWTGSTHLCRSSWSWYPSLNTQSLSYACSLFLSFFSLSVFHSSQCLLGFSNDFFVFW